MNSTLNKWTRFHWQFPHAPIIEIIRVAEEESVTPLLKPSQLTRTNDINKKQE